MAYKKEKASGNHNREPFVILYCVGFMFFMKKLPFVQQVTFPCWSLTNIIREPLVVPLLERV